MLLLQEHNQPLLHVQQELQEHFQVLVQFLLLEAEEEVVAIQQILLLMVKQEDQEAEAELNVDVEVQEILPLSVHLKEILAVMPHQDTLRLLELVAVVVVLQQLEPMVHLVLDQVVAVQVVSHQLVELEQKMVTS